MNPEMGGDVIPLGKGRHRTLVPTAGQTEVVLRLASNVGISKVLVKELGVVKIL